MAHFRWTLVYNFWINFYNFCSHKHIIIFNVLFYMKLVLIVTKTIYYGIYFKNMWFCSIKSCIYLWFKQIKLKLNMAADFMQFLMHFCIQKWNFWNPQKNFSGSFFKNPFKNYEMQETRALYDHEQASMR